jgi:hypothetical protein
MTSRTRARRWRRAAASVALAALPLGLGSCGGEEAATEPEVGTGAGVSEQEGQQGGGEDEREGGLGY